MLNKYKFELESQRRIYENTIKEIKDNFAQEIEDLQERLSIAWQQLSTVVYGSKLKIL